MSNMNRLCRLVAVNKRFVSTQQYVPGRKGYAPGFQAPEGTRETPKINKKRRDIASSLPSHLGSTTKEEAAVNSPKQLYRRELKITRHRYAHELLEKQGQKDLVSAEKLAAAEKKKQELNTYFSQIKQDQKKHEEEVVELLDLELKTKRVDNRTELRNENRLAFDEAQRDTRRKMLLKLYSQTEEFVTLDNLDAKVDAIMSSRRHPQGLDELMNNSSDLHLEIEQRKSQIKEVMGI
ncbi:hypothetical protein G6F46_006308 [Rhizopus delemar]|nr:hypothetical protein G6F43_007925 [Rhizopus delemar]KAG1543874.1 hypothetical protein G6F51_006406 [Rhizopus arrhizus]KAG1459080.1 hypothetical protein G6F55_004974 [Rhizopus delemar]KAG1497700.1 hypothetical protein G6F54_005588 [Rhizopus delemar]KAG1513880.1 hypothetical protein G6F53_004096 [Rhizopus delemar]